MKLLYCGQVVGQILTNRSLSIEECLELLDIDLTETEGGNPKWDYEGFSLQYGDDC